MKQSLLILAVAFMLCVGAHAATGKQPEYLVYFDPAKGFKPAQTNLTDIILQAAASLEYYGSPEPYMRHVVAEQKRIAAAYKAKTGKEARSTGPAYMTSDYVDKTMANWNKLSGPLALDSLAKEIGEDVREGMRGVWGKGTVAIAILNSHQDKLLADMASGKPRSVGFPQLKAAITTGLELDKAKFNTKGYSTARRDAVVYADIVYGRLGRVQKELEKSIPAPQAMQISEAVTGVFMDLAQLAHAELEAGIQLWSLK